MGTGINVGSVWGYELASLTRWGSRAGSMATRLVLGDSQLRQNYIQNSIARWVCQLGFAEGQNCWPGFLLKCGWATQLPGYLSRFPGWSGVRVATLWIRLPAWVAWQIRLQSQQSSLCEVSNWTEVCSELPGQKGPLSWLWRWVALPTYCCWAAELLRYSGKAPVRQSWGYIQQ